MSAQKSSYANDDNVAYTVQGPLSANNNNMANGLLNASACGRRGISHLSGSLALTANENDS